MLYKKQAFKAIVERDEDGWYVGAVPAFPGCYSQGRTLEELYKRLREAVALCQEVAKTNPKYRASIKALAYEPTFVGIETLAL